MTREQMAATEIHSDVLRGSIEWAELIEIAARYDADPHGVGAELLNVFWKVKKDKYGAYYKRCR